MDDSSGFIGIQSQKKFTPNLHQIQGQLVEPGLPGKLLNFLNNYRQVTSSYSSSLFSDNVYRKILIICSSCIILGPNLWGKLTFICIMSTPTLREVIMVKITCIMHVILWYWCFRRVSTTDHWILSGGSASPTSSLGILFLLLHVYMDVGMPRLLTVFAFCYCNNAVCCRHYWSSGTKSAKTVRKMLSSLLTRPSLQRTLLSITYCKLPLADLLYDLVVFMSYFSCK